MSRPPQPRCFTPGNNPGTIEWEFAWAPEPVRVLLEKKNSLAPSGIRNPGFRDKKKINQLSQQFTGIVSHLSEKSNVSK